MAEEQKHNIMTAESLKKLQERYDYLLNVKRKEIINAIEIARGFGDLSENAEYTEARNDQAKNEAEITRLKALIENAEVVDESELSTDRVSVGITVRYENTDTGVQSEYGIVGAGADEADPDEGRISSESPIGAALLARLSAILWTWKFRAARCTCALWTSIADLSDFRIGLVRRRFRLCGGEPGA